MAGRGARQTVVAGRGARQTVVAGRGARHAVVADGGHGAGGEQTAPGGVRAGGIVTRAGMELLALADGVGVAAVGIAGIVRRRAARARIGRSPGGRVVAGRRAGIITGLLARRRPRRVSRFGTVWRRGRVGRRVAVTRRRFLVGIHLRVGTRRVGRPRFVPGSVRGDVAGGGNVAAGGTIGEPRIVGRRVGVPGARPVRRTGRVGPGGSRGPGVRGIAGPVRGRVVRTGPVGLVRTRIASGARAVRVVRPLVRPGTAHQAPR